MAKLGGQATSAKTIFAGFGIGFLYKAMNVAFRWWKDTPERVFGAPFAAGSAGLLAAVAKGAKQALWLAAASVAVRAPA